MCFSPYWGGGGLPRGLGHNLLMQFSSLGVSKMETSKTDFFDILTIQNDKISYIKHVLAPFYVFFTVFGCVWGVGGGSQGGWGTTCLHSFPASAAQEWSSLSPLRAALPKAIEFLIGRRPREKFAQSLEDGGGGGGWGIGGGGFQTPPSGDAELLSKNLHTPAPAHQHTINTQHHTAAHTLTHPSTPSHTLTHPRTPSSHTLTHPHTPSYTLTHPHTPLHTLTHPHTPSHTLTHPHAPSHTLTHPHTPSQTLTHPHTPSHTLTHPHTPSHTLTHPHTPSHTLTHPHTPSHTLTHPHTPSHTLIHPHTPSHTLTHPHTPSHTLTHPHTPSHTLTHPHTPGSSRPAGSISGTGALASNAFGYT